MPRKLRRKLLSFTKFKRPLPPESSPDDHHPGNKTNPTLVKRYNFLYHEHHNPTYNNSIPKPFGAYLNSRPSSSSSSSSSSEPDLATIFASERLFFSSPGRSNSITEAAVSSSSIASSFRGGRDSVAVPTYSPDPYRDFRRSMEEMVEAYELEDVHANWESLNELLSCYLALNPESNHGYIIGAFSDLLVGLLSASTRRRKARAAPSGGRDYMDGGGW